MIAIVDYGVGNLFSLQSSLRSLGLETEVTGEAERLRRAERIILPGVGAFGDARAKLDATRLVPVLLEEAEQKPLLGIHLGWNRLEIVRDDPLFRESRRGEYVYYVHSFYARRCEDSVLATSEYGGVAVPGVVRRGNVWGAQFHPEKSGEAGLRLLRAFAEL